VRPTYVYRRFWRPETRSPNSWREFRRHQRSAVPSVATSAPPALVVATPDITRRDAASRAPRACPPNRGQPRGFPRRPMRHGVGGCLEDQIEPHSMNPCRVPVAPRSLLPTSSPSPSEGLWRRSFHERVLVQAVDKKGTPGIRRHEHVGLGLAVDVERADGSRNLWYPDT